MVSFKRSKAHHLRAIKGAAEYLIHGIEIRRVTDQAHIEEIDQISRFLIEMLLGQLVQEDCTQIDIEDIESLHDPQTARAK